MKVLLTGATGLIGKEIGKLLVQKGHEVLAVSRSRSRAELELPFKAQFIEWNGGIETFPTAVMESVDAVVNLMGENLADQRWSANFKKHLYDSRVFSTRSLVSSALNAKNLKVWVQGSAVGFYGEAKSQTVFDEESPRGKSYLAELCEDWEGETELLNDSVRRVIVRTGVVFSHKGGAFAQMHGPMMNGLGGALGSGEQKMSLIHLEDMARFMVHAIENESTQGIYNAVAEDPIRQKELAQKMALGLQVKLGPSVPGFALRIAMGEMADTILENQPVISKRLKEAGFSLKYPTAHDIVNEVTSWFQNPVDQNSSAFVVFAEQFVPHSIDKVFAFFSSAKNLESLTPDFLHFEIQKVSTPEIVKGTHIEYQLKIHGIPVNWLTEITDWNPPYQFVDLQLKGPYALWHHEHRFEEVEGGTLITDWVRYRVPLGKLGQWVGLSKVRSDIGEIFKFRRQKIKSVNWSS